MREGGGVHGGEVGRSMGRETGWRKTLDHKSERGETLKVVLEQCTLPSPLSVERREVGLKMR